MKVVVAIDSFKGSLSSMEAGNAARAGIKKACNADVVVTGDGQGKCKAKYGIGCRAGIPAFALKDRHICGNCGEAGIVQLQ